MDASENIGSKTPMLNIVEDPALKERVDSVERMLNTLEDRIGELEKNNVNTRNENIELKGLINSKDLIIRLSRQICAHYIQIAEYRRQQLWKERGLAFTFLLSLFPLTLINLYVSLPLSLGIWTVIGSFWFSDKRSTITNYFLDEIKRLNKEILDEEKNKDPVL